MTTVLPDAAFVINMCGSRHAFMLALKAAWQQGQTHLLPPNASVETLRGLHKAYPESYILTDNPQFVAPEGVPCHYYTPLLRNSSVTKEIPDSHPAVIVFTSGSTGNPVGHMKTYGMLKAGALLAAKRFGFASLNEVIIATVPHQHMYGLETAIMLPMMGYASCYDGMPFYPADLDEACNKVLGKNPDATLTLITTPLHLETFVKAEVKLSCFRQIISATAPLSHEIVQNIKDIYQVPVYEIYGCTEAGSMASRPRDGEGESERWKPYDTFNFQKAEEGTFVSAPHLPEPITLGDQLNLHHDGTFSLEGRNSDMLNIAGKRASLEGLQAILRKMPSIDDGALCVEENISAVQRLTAILVPQNKEFFDKEAFLREFAKHIDPVFLPRRIVLVDALPRLPTGKIPKHALNVLLQKEHSFPESYPVFAGHFPGNPLVPGVLLLACIEEALEKRSIRISRIISAKFLAPIGPEQPFEVKLSDTSKHPVHAEVISKGEMCAKLVCEVV